MILNSSHNDQKNADSVVSGDELKSTARDITGTFLSDYSNESKNRTVPSDYSNEPKNGYVPSEYSHEINNGITSTDNSNETKKGLFPTEISHEMQTVTNPLEISHEMQMVTAPSEISNEMKTVIDASSELSPEMLAAYSPEELINLEMQNLSQDDGLSVKRGESRNTEIDRKSHGNALRGSIKGKEFVSSKSTVDSDYIKNDKSVGNNINSDISRSKADNRSKEADGI